MKFQTPAKAHTAFTLIEVLIASLIATMAFLALFSGFTMAASIQRQNEELLRATVLTREAVELMHTYSWSTITNTSFASTTSTNYLYPDSDANTSDGAQFVITTQVLNEGSTANYSNSIRTLRIQVNWTSNGKPWSRELKTLISSAGLLTRK